ncbi:MAG: DUF6318 family protein [Actinomycetaceae bacterium]|nr:DUF6318 family protein [Actinomycetaceae bacterium]
MRTFYRIAVRIMLPVLVLAGCAETSTDTRHEVVEPLPSQARITEKLSEAPTEEPTTALVPPTKEELYPHPKPVIPEAAKARTKEGAMAFAEYFVEVYAYATATRDPQALMEVCTDAAGFCLTNVEFIEHNIESGTYKVGYFMYDLEATGALEGGTTDRVEWGAQVIGYIAPYELQNVTSGERAHMEESRFVAGVELAWLDGWKVEEAQALPYEEVYDD